MQCKWKCVTGIFSAESYVIGKNICFKYPLELYTAVRITI